MCERGGNGEELAERRRGLQRDADFRIRVMCA